MGTASPEIKNMPAQQKYIEGILKRTALLIAILVAVSIPTIYAITEYQELSDTLAFKAKVKAAAVNELIAKIPDTWQFAENQIQGLLSHVPVPIENEYIEIQEKRGSVITHAGDPLSKPVISVSHPLSDSGNTVGNLVISLSLNAYLTSVAASIFLSIALAFLTFLTLKILPLRALRRANDKLFSEMERAETTLHAIHDAVITTDTSGRIDYVNPAAQQLLGYSLNELIGKSIKDTLHLFKAESDEKVECPLDEALLKNKMLTTTGDNAILHANGFKVEIEDCYTPIHGSDGKVSGSVIVLRDVSFARNYVKQRTWEATHDLLTGLKNRQEFEKCVQTALARTKQSGISYVLCHMNLDRFKLINDTSGHAAGDELLIRIAELMATYIRKTDCLARLGGDEYGLLLENCDMEIGLKIATAIKAAIDNFDFSWEDERHAIGVSIGLAMLSPEHHHTTEIIGEADNACYWAKENGLSQVAVSTASNQSLSARRGEIYWVARINNAFRENRFVLYQQPYRTLNTSLEMEEHIEVLIRMIDEDGKIVPPGHFLPAAERYAMMPEIDRWVISQIFSKFESLIAKRNGKPAIYCINLSGATINAGNFLQFIREELMKYKLPPKAICFELTETVAINNLESASAFISESKAIGFSFALDDFGSGTSSFGYLKALPVDYLKIDGHFIKDIEHDQIDLAMVESINRIGHLLGKLTVAEFVENDKVIKMLEEMGVDFAQGYGISKPCPLPV